MGVPAGQPFGAGVGAGPVQGAQAPRPDHPGKFNTYRFADHKERVIDLLKRVCTVSVETVRIVDRLDLMTDIDPDEGLALRPEFAAGLQASVDARAAGEPTVLWEEVKRRLGV